ncbi:MAG: single-stranded DNA-binding protein [Clostridia bacterium]|nr:single-stranded DNA-binding protein [Clostridia bacterium]
MQYRYNDNIAAMTGKVIELPTFSHKLYDDEFFKLKIAVRRLSGAMDEIPVMIAAGNIPSGGVSLDDIISVSGQLRSYNKPVEGVNRLIITVFARSMLVCGEDADCENEVSLVGHICKPVIYRKTPLMREICDILLAVNRAYGKSDYLPCIAWGKNARFAQELSVGDTVEIYGRLQSRNYVKLTEDGSMERTAYEVSTTTITQL